MFRTVLASSLLVRLGFAFPTVDASKPEPVPLQWTICDLDFNTAEKRAIAAHGEPIYCATLPVPLDYTNTDSGKTVDLQLIKIKATKEPFKGSVLTNPGGPGGSGVDWIATDGPGIRDKIGGYHDVIGFDPRGTGRTLPYACLPATASASKMKRAEYNFTIPQSDAYAFLLKKSWHDSSVWAETCESANSEIAPYLGTTFVARDMIEIITALGEDQLQYWGISYGTVLGQTFAGMFPDRVKRIVLDSALRFDDYYAGHWITVTRDTERALVNFLNECVNAGPAECPIANFTGPETTAGGLHQELAKVFQELLDDPVYMPDNYTPLRWLQPGDLTVLQSLKYILLALAYRPIQFGALYVFVDIALRRAWPEYIELSTAQTTNSSTPAERLWNLGTDAFHGITCSDTVFRANKPEDLYSLVRAQAAAGSFSDGFSPQIWPCAQWKTEAKERYTGPFTAINTSYPILFVNGNHDPITPLSAAYEASANFPESRLVVQNGHGHGIMNHPSACTTKVISDYFTEGTMPEAGTVCQTDTSAYQVFIDLVLEPLLNSTSNATLTKRNLQEVRKVVLPF
ncbi:hypothetical protein ACN47E_005565 [Coniothyrium glycines]